MMSPNALFLVMSIARIWAVVGCIIHSHRLGINGFILFSSKKHPERGKECGRMLSFLIFYW